MILKSKYIAEDLTMMFPLRNQNLLGNPYVRDIALTILFGLLSFSLSNIQFQIPGFAGRSNLQEIPLLICLFHLRSSVFIAFLALFTLKSTNTGIPYFLPFVVHLASLIIAHIAYKQIEKKGFSDVISGVTWMLFTIAYFFVFLIPFIAIAFQLLSINNGKTIWQCYVTILSSIEFEVITTVLITGLYLVQHQIRRTLQFSNRNLEQLVNSRTIELTLANRKLNSLNETLEKMVRERTNKINEQLNQLVKYANMNSHEVRAPLASMLGLLQLIKREKNMEDMPELLDKLFKSSTDLDVVIRKMNRLLEKEVHINVD